MRRGMEWIECTNSESGNMFEPKKISHKYCTTKCKNRANTLKIEFFVTTTCEKCDKPFKARYKSNGSTCPTCTPKIVERICEWCENHF